MAIRFTLFALGAGMMALLGLSQHQSSASQTAPQSSERPLPPTREIVDVSTPKGAARMLLSPSFKPEVEFQSGMPNGWTEEKPYITKGKSFEGPEIQKAIKMGVDYILDQQDEDGSWDVVLSGASLLGDTADDAVDTIIATSLSGLALRAHAGADQERIDKALQKARDFVADRITRGKLPTRVWYACWRYAFGIKFMANEYKYLADGDEENRERLLGVISRMRDSVIKMQLISHDKQFSEGDPMPTSLGIKVAPPTSTDYLGGAPIEAVAEGSRASIARAGSLGKLQPGDRIFKVGRKRIENAYDYYSAEAEMIEGKTYDLYVRREGVTAKTSVFAERIWPADVGVIVKDFGDGEGAEITEFRRGSVAQAGGAVIGDVIVKLGNENVKDAASFEIAEAGLKIWKNNETIRVQRGKKRDSVKVFVRPRPTADLGFEVNDEDKSSENGVGVAQCPIFLGPGNTIDFAAKAGLRTDDFITEINGIKILGYDHYLDVLSRLPGYSMVNLKILRDGEAQEISYRSDGNPFAGWFGMTLDENFDETNRDQLALVGTIEKRTPADKADIRAGDRILSAEINGQKIAFGEHPMARFYGEFAIAQYFMGVFVAGDVVKFEVERGSAKFTKEMTADMAPGEAVLAEGGWCYYPKGLAPSFTTAAMMIFFDEIEDILGKDFALPRKSQKAAVAAVQGMRQKDTVNNDWGYVYDQRDIEKDLAGAPDDVKKRAKEGWKDLRGHMGRLMVCELALGVNNKRTKTAIRNSLKIWLDHRDELDIVRNYPITHYQKRWNNAAYYWLFGHYFTLRSANYLGKGKEADTVRELVLSVTMQDRESDGTWLGHHSFGKLCGTSLALMILGEYEEPWRLPSGKAKPITPGGSPE